MPFVTLLHNPEAGTASTTKDSLLTILQNEGYRCRYLSSEGTGNDLLDPEAEFIVVAGGDGTVRKVIRQLLVHQAGGRTWPVAILPMGTANNIAATLGLDAPVQDLVAGWKNGQRKKYDVAGITGLEEGSFFLEGFGFGLFPHMMRRMQALGEMAEDSREEKLRLAIALLHRRLAAYPEKNCLVEVDGKDYSGKYFLVEVMNSSFIGPNLLLSLHSDPGDGKLEIVLLREKDKVRFAKYLYVRRNGGEADFPFHALKGSSIRLGWSGRLSHLDDLCFKQKKGSHINIQVLPGMLQFLVP